MITYLARHGVTRLSARYLVNGDPARPVGLDANGRAQARALAAEPWVPSIVTCLVSEFPRTGETARLILGGRGPALLADPLLNEIDYGRYEGGGWLDYGGWLRTAGVHGVPAGGRESWLDACDRLLRGLEAALARPGPRLVIGHGIMISLVAHLNAGGALAEPTLPEARYARPLVLPDAELRRVIAAGRMAILAVASPTDTTTPWETERDAQPAAAAGSGDRRGAPPRPPGV
jgi:probable phosphoglycerate mutase